MDGSGFSLIVIPIVVVASLAAWLIIVYYANSHPLWRHRPTAPRADAPRADTQPAALATRPQPGHRSAPERRAA
jgi:hypothetical protein